MNAAVISVVGLILAVLVSLWRKVNFGVVCIGFAFICGYFLSGKLDPPMKVSEIYMKGFPLSLLFLLLGASLFSAIARANGTYDILGKPIAALANGRRRLLCLVFFLISFLVSGIGLGTIATPLLLMPFLLVTGKQEEIPELLTMLICIAGCIAGGLSPLAPTGALGIELAKKLGVENYTPIYAAALVTFCFQAVIIFLYFGGAKLTRLPAKPFELPAVNGKQLATILGLFCIITAVALKLDLGLSAFTVTAVLILFGAVDQDKVIKGIPWGVMLLICGASVMFYVMSRVGGIKLITEHMAGSGFDTSFLAGLMAFFSSPSAQVMPTLIPTISGGSANSVYLAGAIIIGAHSAAYSPLSTMGAVAMNLVSSKAESDKIFVKLFCVAIAMLVVTCFLFLLGFYDSVMSFAAV